MTARPALQQHLPEIPTDVARIATDADAIAAAHRLAADFEPSASERDRDRRLPWDKLTRWSASGLGAITVPRAHGGPQVSYATLAEVFVILNAADPSIGQIPQNHFGVLGVLREIGTTAQKNSASTARCWPVAGWAMRGLSARWMAQPTSCKAAPACAPRRMACG
ncbi:acyl-CoA dehydrogenase family protein [Acidovorax sp. SUPP3334]|uniref:acyl-CoA dehydrogenase family protein n=1 Tax=Acidovorax sp. SUPP3334 TaxID=2920881 RepID=UPI0023DE2046|nr:acyl-CoA dehydrogenase family protein [Acidovorax sp. SUPP3334]GKT22840.1 hypothetical protein AVHM3334_09705 [Acidovorax sp. SUPP3334]